jgi:cell division protein FtsA
MLNGGVVLTGGGSQLKHLIQLTEYVTGMNARIGFPNEHLAAGHFEELSKPQYSTCIGLILKGYDVHESTLNTLQRYRDEEIVLEKFNEDVVVDNLTQVEENDYLQVGDRSNKLSFFFRSFRDRLIEIFEPESDIKM